MKTCTFNNNFLCKIEFLDVGHMQKITLLLLTTILHLLFQGYKLKGIGTGL